MEILTEQQISDRLRDGKPVSAQLEGGGFQIHVDRYVPMVATAIHDGHRVDIELADRMLVSSDQRQFEEDPYTGAIAAGFDIWIKALDSRYCYDLNRQPEHCIYEEAWGRQVWKKPLNESEKEVLRDRHGSYYRVLNELLGTLVSRFGGTVLYDLHSYNYSRLNGQPPLFNIGTHFIDLQKYRQIVDDLVSGLEAIDLVERQNRVAVNEVFRGRGYQAEFINRYHKEVLCVPLEIKKIFMDEISFELNETTFKKLRSGMIEALVKNGAYFRDTSACQSRENHDCNQVRE